MDARPSVRTALVRGLQRTHALTRYVAAAYLCNVLLAAVLGAVLMGAIRTSLGASAAGERMRDGFDSLWFNSFSAQATGVAATFRPSVTGIGAVFDAIDSFLDGFAGVRSGGTGTGIVPIALLYWLVSLFFSSGFVAFAWGGSTRRSFILESCRWLPGIAAISAASVIVYWFVLGVVRPSLDDAVAAAVRNTIDERQRFAAVALEYAVVWAAVWLVNMVSDYAKIALVGSSTPAGIRGVARAVVNGVRAIVRRPLRTIGLYVLLGCVWIVGVMVYWLVVPGATDSSTLTITAALVLGQVFVATRIWTRCLFYASETAMFAAIVRPRLS